jgi:hypothetical protein
LFFKSKCSLLHEKGNIKVPDTPIPVNRIGMERTETRRKKPRENLLAK